MRLARRQVATLLLITIIAYGGSGFACGSSSAIKSFRLALASSGPLVDSLVTSGAIPQTKATAIITDFNDGAGCALTLQNAFTAIPSDLSDREKTVRKLNASVNALRCWRAIIDRQNFSAYVRVKHAADIAEGILASMVVFYSEPGEARASTVEAATIAARNEKDLEARLRTQVKALERAMQP